MAFSVWTNWLLTVGTVLSAYVLLPYNIHHLGDQAYGTWILITSVTGYLGLLTLGAPMATLRFVARYVAEEDTENLNKTLGTFAGLYLAIGAGAILIGLILFFLFGAIYTVPPELTLQSRISFLIAVLCVGIGFIQQLPYGIMAAYKDFGVRNAVNGGVLAVRLAVNLLLVWKWPHLLALAVLNLIVSLFEMALCWVVLHRRYPQLRISLEHFDLAMLRSILSFSVFVMLLLMGLQLSYQTDALVIGGFMDVGAIPYYTSANSLTVYLMQFVSAIAIVVMPTATAFHARDDLASLRRLFLRWSKITLSLTLLTGSFLLVLGPRFLAWWLGPAFEGDAGNVLRVLMLSFLVFLPAVGVAQPVLMGIGKSAAPGVAFVVAGLLNLGLSLLLVKPFGLVGVAWGTAIPNALLAVAMIYLAARSIAMPLPEYFRYVVWRPLLGSIPGVLFLWWTLETLDVHGFLALFFSGMGLICIFGSIWVVFVYRNDKEVDLMAWIRQKLNVVIPSP